MVFLYIKNKRELNLAGKKACDLKSLRDEFLKGDFVAEVHREQRLLFAMHCSNCTECQKAVTVKYQANNNLVLQTLNQIVEDLNWDKGVKVLKLMKIRMTPIPQ